MHITHYLLLYYDQGGQMLDHVFHQFLRSELKQSVVPWLHKARPPLSPALKPTYTALHTLDL
ncbi:hypothetical protein EON64_11440, partial [archaeon]